MKTEAGIDRIVAESFEAMPTARPVNTPNVSPDGLWRWRVASFTNIGEGTWEPVASLEPWVTLKMLEWLYVCDDCDFEMSHDTSGYEVELTLWNKDPHCGFTFVEQTLPEAIRRSYLKARNLEGM